jgi:hypothetical protein
LEELGARVSALPDANMKYIKHFDLLSQSRENLGLESSGKIAQTISLEGILKERELLVPRDLFVVLRYSCLWVFPFITEAEECY